MVNVSVPVDPVLVIGATGRVGRLVVNELLREGVPVRALSRTPAAAQLPTHVDVFAGDLTVPESLEPALQGVSAVFLLWTAPPATAADVIARIAAHTKRIVLLSSPHQTPHPFFQQPNPMAAFHAEIERLIAVAGLASTIIRPGMFASNMTHWWGPQIRQGTPVRWPYGAAETAPIDERDIAAVIACALTDDRHAGRDYVLTGPESLSHTAQVAIIGDAIGKTIQFVELSPEEFRRDTAGLWPPALVDILLAAWAATMGRPAFVTSSVLDVTGSPARTFRQWVDDHIAAFDHATYNSP